MHPQDTAGNSLVEVISATNIINQKYRGLYYSFFAQKLFEDRDYKTGMSVLDGLLYDAEELEKDTKALVSSRLWGKECDAISLLLPYQELLVRRIASLRAIIDHQCANPCSHAYTFSDYDKDVKMLNNMETQSMKIEKRLYIVSNPDISHDMCFSSEAWFFKLFHGYYPLPKAYWQFGVLGGCAAQLILGFLFGLNVPLNEILLIIATFLVVAYHVICLVGIWRSASHYHGRKIWAMMARFWVVCGWLTLFGLISGFIFMDK